MLSSNLLWLETNHPIFHAHLSNASEIYNYDNQNDILFEYKNVLSTNFKQKSRITFQDNLNSPSQVRLQRESLTVNESYPIGSLITELVDCLGHKVLPYVLNSVSPPTDQASTPKSNDYLLVGISALPDLLEYISIDNKYDSISSVTVVESSLSAMVYAFSNFSLQDVISKFKMHHIAFHMIYEKEFIPLREQLYDYFLRNIVCCYYGLKVITACELHDSLTLLRAYIFSKSGLAPRLLSNLGTSSDEYNQVLEAVGNLCLNSINQNLISDLPKFSPNDNVIIVASGPSLDSNIEYLKSASKYSTLVASGSSLGALIKNGIPVDLFVQLERGSGAYLDLLELVQDGYSLSKTTLVASYAIDPRLVQFFDNVYYFHRPISTYTLLFPDDESSKLPHAGPECANSSLELCLALEAKSIALFGCDFAASVKKSHRAANAIGKSPRNLDVPTIGSFGKTVFTDSGLSLVAEVFEYVCMSHPNTQIYRIGEGIRVRGTINISGSEFLQKFTSPISSKYCIPTLLDDSNSLLNSYDPQRILIAKKILDSIPSAVHDLDEEIKAFFSDKHHFDASVHRFISKLIDCAPPGPKDELIARSIFLRMFRQVFYSMFQFLYDSGNESQFDSSVQIFTETFAICADIQIATSLVMVEMLETTLNSQPKVNESRIWEPTIISRKIVAKLNSR